MPGPKNYTDELQEFNSKYHLTNFSIERLEGYDEEFGAATDFLHDRAREVTPAANFISWVNRALGIYLETELTMHEGGEYNFSQFSFDNFLADFDRLAKAKHDQTLVAGQPSTWSTYAGADAGRIRQGFQNHMVNINRTLPDLWASRVKLGYMKIETMEQLTDRENVALLNGSAGLKGINSKLTNIVAAYETMAKVRKSRGFFWKIFNFRKNGREKEYFQKLTDQVNGLFAQDYDIPRIRQNLATTVFGQIRRVEDAPEVQQQPETVSVASRPKSLAKMLSDKLTAQFKKNFSFEIVNHLPKNAIISTKMGQCAVEANMDQVYDAIKTANSAYIQQTNAGTSAQEAMENYTFHVYRQVFEFIGDLGYATMQDKIIATQMFTDKILEEISPCSLDESLREFTNGYVVKHSDKFLEKLKTMVAENDYTNWENAFNEINSPRELIGMKNPIADDNIMVEPVNVNDKIENPAIQQIK